MKQTMAQYIIQGESPPYCPQGNAIWEGIACQGGKWGWRQSSPL